MLQVKDIT
jgi:putative transposase